MSTFYEVEESPSPPPTTNSDNVSLKIDLNLKQSLTGFGTTVTLKHLDGKQLRIEKAGVTKHGSEELYPGLGRWKDSKQGQEVVAERGNVIVRYCVKFPERLTREQRRVLGEVFGW